MTRPEPLARARAAWMQHDAAATLAAAQPHCTSPDPSTRASALLLCGHAVRHLGHTTEATRLYRAALAADPNRAETWTAIGSLFARNGHETDALHAHTRASQCVPSAPGPWEHIAAIHTRAGRHDQAADAWRQARARAPHRPELALHEATSVHDAGRAEAAHEVVLRALQRFPRDVQLHLRAASHLADCRRADESLLHLDHAVAAAPRSVAARMRRAEHYVRSRRYADAVVDLRDVVEHHPDYAVAGLQLARIALLEGRLDDAGTTLAGTLDRPMSATNHGHALLLRAEVHGKQGHLEAEWDDLVAGQAVLAAPQVDVGDDGTPFLAAVAQLTRRLAPGGRVRTAAASFPMVPPEGAVLVDRPPVFMFGFPRSGTTLCERILGAHPAFTATDELDLLGAMLHSIDDELDETPCDALTDDQVRHLRQVFVRKAVHAGYDPTTTRLIDKNPLNFIFVDLVRRIFPDAPIIMILRDPRDCVWSAFRQAFAPNPALVLTRELRLTATLYRAVFDLWQHGRALPGLRLTEVHYEHIVEDFEAGARRLVAATGEAWDDQVLDYPSRLGSAFVRTPSFALVGQKVRRTRVGRWRRHAERFDEVADLLAPYVQTLGVEAVAPGLMA